MIKREGIKKGVYILPNLLTLASLFCGFFAIVKALQGDFSAAAWSVMAAGIFDGLDGRVARLTRTQSEFGIELDSLCDLVSFGLAPAVIAFQWNLAMFHKMGWGVCFVFVACGALRLARYNVQFSDEEKRHFQGLPIPTAAYALVSYILFMNTRSIGESWIFLALVFGLSLLMVSKVPYRSFKSLGVRHRYSFFYLVMLIGILFLIASAPNTMIFLFAIAYISFGLVEALLNTSLTFKNRLALAYLVLRNLRSQKLDELHLAQVLRDDAPPAEPDFEDMVEKPLLVQSDGGDKGDKKEMIH